MVVFFIDCWNYNHFGFAKFIWLILIFWDFHKLMTRGFFFFFWSVREFHRIRKPRIRKVSDPLGTGIVAFLLGPPLPTGTNFSHFSYQFSTSEEKVVKAYVKALVRVNMDLFRSCASWILFPNVTEEKRSKQSRRLEWEGLFRGVRGRNPRKKIKQMDLCERQ